MANAQADTLVDILVKRRTRRFPRGAEMPKEGPLGFKVEPETGQGTSSVAESNDVEPPDDEVPRPEAKEGTSSVKGPSDEDWPTFWSTFAEMAGGTGLTPTQIAYLAFAAVGITGAALGDLPYQEDEWGGGTLLTRLVSRTALSADASHAAGVFVIMDGGVHFLRRPQNLTREELLELDRLLWSGSNGEEETKRGADERQDRVLRMYFKLAVSLDMRKDNRFEITDERPHVPTFNRWNRNKPGSVVFLPVLEMSELYLGAILAGFHKHTGGFLVDDRNGLVPAGVADFAKSEGGNLDDDFKGDLVFTHEYFETSIVQYASVELGAILQNMSLMAQALGVGGWPNYAAGTKWLELLGFDHDDIMASKLLGLPDPLKRALRLQDKDKQVWSPLGLEHPRAQTSAWDGKGPDPRYLIKPYCPPYFESMEAAVNAFIEHKYGEGGNFRQGGNPGPWKEEHDKTIRQGIGRHPPEQIDAVIEHCTYVHERYGRFPAKFGPVMTIAAFQAHLVEGEFYKKFYRPELASSLG